MTALELNTKKLEFIRDFLEENDDEVVQMQIDYFRSIKEESSEKIPGLPYTDEERIASVKEGYEQYLQGLGIPHNEVFKEFGLK